MLGGKAAKFAKQFWRSFATTNQTIFISLNPEMVRRLIGAKT
jgi:hypothetical protein